MVVGGTGTLERFAKKHARSRPSLRRFLTICQEAEWTNLVGLKTAFPGTDYVNGTYIFNIGGDKYRLLAAIDFEEQLLAITEVLTHEEYNRKKL